MLFNINGLGGKLENHNVALFLSKFDVFAILELKTGYYFSLPGYQVIRSRPVNGENCRGGVAVFVRNNFWPFVTAVKTFVDQVWLSLPIMSNVTVGVS